MVHGESTIVYAEGRGGNDQRCGVQATLPARSRCTEECLSEFESGHGRSTEPGLGVRSVKADVVQPHQNIQRTCAFRSLRMLPLISCTPLLMELWSL